MTVTNFRVQWRGLNHESFELSIEYKNDEGQSKIERLIWDHPVRGRSHYYYATWDEDTLKPLEHKGGNHGTPEKMFDCLTRFAKFWEGIPTERKAAFIEQAVLPLRRFLVETCLHEADTKISKGLGLLTLFKI